MALKPQYYGEPPIGIFDGYDAQISSFLGGEVVSLAFVKLGNDKAAYDVENDGYFGVANNLRPVVTKTLVSGMRPLFLSDDGIANYGTLLGSVLGGNAGLTVTGGVVLGPSTATGSGKITCWTGGVYDVTLDAVDTTAGTGLVPSNGTLTGGDALYASTAGLLTPNTGNRFENVTVGRFLDFVKDGGSLVSTPSTLARATNSPVGALPVKANFTSARIRFSPPA